MTVSYELEFAKSFERDLRSLPRETAARVMENTLKLASKPRPRNSRKLRGTEDEYRIRIGDYRVFYTIDDPTHTVTVFHVAHRREAYR